MNSSPAASPARYMQAMPSIKNIILFLPTLFILCLISACNNSESNSLIGGLEIPSNNVNKDDSLSRTELDSMFESEMSQYNEIRWTDGYTGKESVQSIRYNWFSNWATNEELLHLVNSKNTNTKVYAFMALKNRSNVDLKPIILRHLRDTCSFVETYGCIGYSKKRVNSYFFEGSPSRFTKNEILKYRNLISQLNSKFNN
jgi:hypothetical protein